MSWSAPEALLLVYPSIHYVLKAEKVLQHEGLPCELIPMPRELRSDCGMALLCHTAELPRLRQFLETTGNLPEACYRPQGKGYILVF